MSQNEVDHDADDLESNSAVPKAKKHDSGAADLERVTDYAEEKEITGQRLSNVRIITTGVQTLYITQCTYQSYQIMVDCKT